LTELSTLPNGLRVLTDAMPGLETAAVGLYLDTGSRFEAAAENGVAHLLEHMVFKGTRTRSARAIAEQIEDVGGAMNAFTARDMTAFHARVLAGDVPLAVELIADLVSNPVLDPAEMEKEREVVLQELGEARDTPDDIIHDNLQETAFADQPLGRPVLGSDATIAALDRPTLASWMERCFRGPSAVLVAAGKVDHAAVRDLAERHLGGLPNGARPEAEPGRYTGGEHLDPRKFEQAHVTLGYEGPGHADALHTPTQLFALACGGGMSSRLFQELREERGLVYSIFAHHQPYADTGLFSVYFACGQRAAGRARALAEDVLAACATGLDAPELERAKAQAKAALLMSLEGAQGRSEYLARQMLVHGRAVAPADVVAKIEAATVDTVRAAGRALLERRQTRATVGMKKAA